MKKRVKRVKSAIEKPVEPVMPEQLPVLQGEQPEQPVIVMSDTTYESFNRRRAGTRRTGRAGLSWADKVIMFGTAGRYPIRSITPLAAQKRNDAPAAVTARIK